MDKILICVTAYLLGSIPFGFLAARLAGTDITKKGSGNIGATNVLRTLGVAYAIPVLLLDAGKGALAAYVGLKFMNMGILGAIIPGALAIAGHNWSMFLKFKGGRGVAATAGVALVAFPLILAIAVGVFVLVVVITKYVSLGSILAVWSAFFMSLFPGQGTAVRVAVFILSIVITYQHRSNIKRLMSGTENKILFQRSRQQS